MDQNTKLVKSLIDRTRKEGYVSSSDENIDFKEGIGHQYKGFFVQIFTFGDMFKAFGATETPAHSVRFESDLKESSRAAGQQVYNYINAFRKAKPNSNMVVN